MPREILVDWTTASGAGKVSVFWFLTPTAVASQRAALAACLGNVDGVLDNSTSWTIRTAGREVNDATGVLTGVWSDGTSYTGTGARTVEPLADASQLLIQWRTDHIVEGRFLQGRTYIPGLSTEYVTSGNVSPDTVTALGVVVQDLVDAAVQLCVWHRPQEDSLGVAWAVDTATVWNELAVLRRRRN
jgi:hypothetical protein